MLRTVWLVIVLAVAACTSSGEGDKRQRCAQLRDHLVDLRLRQVEGSGAAIGSMVPTVVPAAPGRPAEVVPPPRPIDLEAHRRVMKQALGAHFLDTCEKSYDDARVRCVLAAKTPDAVTACNHPTPRTASN